MRFSDNDPSTWESASLTNAVPASTTRVVIRLGINENVDDDEILAHFFDNIKFGLIVPFFEPPKELDAIMLMIR